MFSFPWYPARPVPGPLLRRGELLFKSSAGCELRRVVDIVTKPARCRRCAGGEQQRIKQAPEPERVIRHAAGKAHGPSCRNGLQPPRTPTGDSLKCRHARLGVREPSASPVRPSLHTMACTPRHNAHARHKGTLLLASLSWRLSTARTKIVLAQRAERVRRMARRKLKMPIRVVRMDWLGRQVRSLWALGRPMSSSVRTGLGARVLPPFAAPGGRWPRGFRRPLGR